MPAAHPANPAVFIASHDAEDYARLLARELGDQVPVNTVVRRAAVLAGYDGEPILLGRPDFLVDLLKSRPPVQWVQSTWAGVTPLVEIDFRDYRLTGVKDVFGRQMAEYVFGYLLVHELRLEQRRDSQHQHRWDDTPSGTLGGKVMGIMGTGSIGIHLAHMARAFAITPIGFNSRGEPLEPFAQVYTGDTLTAFLQQCDYLVGVLPATPATSNLLDAAAFAAMKKSAYLVNVGRGNLVDDDALVNALREQQLAGAVLDVFRDEPLAADSVLWDAPGLRITGHVAAVSLAADIARLFVDNYRRFTSGEKLQHLVDFDKGY